MSSEPQNFDLPGPESLPDHGQPANSPQRQRAALVRGLQHVGATDPGRRAELLATLCEVEGALGNGEDAWHVGREALDIFITTENWEGAVKACVALFLSGHPDSLKALAHGIWLAVTYPIEPQLTVRALEQLVEESAHDDIGAVAATTAHYVANLRGGEGEAGDKLRTVTSRLLQGVAWTHSKVEDQVGFDEWFKGRGLDDPGTFLPLFSQALDKIVGDEWWFDRDALRARLPEE